MPDGPWLTDEQQRAWRAYLRVSELLNASLSAQLQRDAGIPQTYYVVLAMLSEAPARTLRMSDLAAIANASPSRLSHAVGKLESRGWITRTPSPCDGRSTLATLTEEGMAFLVEQAPGHVAAVRAAIFDRLSPEQVRQFSGALADILTGLEVDCDDQPRESER